jgi:hypothetical protein
MDRSVDDLAFSRALKSAGSRDWVGELGQPQIEGLHLYALLIGQRRGCNGRGRNRRWLRGGSGAAGQDRCYQYGE